MNSTNSSIQNIGVCGTGQLGRMLGIAALNLGLNLRFLGPDSGSISRQNGFDVLTGDIQNKPEVVSFGLTQDGVTYEIESVSVEALEELEAKGVLVCPSSAILKIIQNKIIQKQFLSRNDFPTSKFETLTGSEVIQRLKSGKELNCVIKAAEGGYDGRGVFIPDSSNQVNLSEKINPLAEYLLEDRIAIAHEVSVMVARGLSGETRVYDPVAMIMNPVTHQLDYLIAPAQISEVIQSQIHALAQRMAESLKLVGILAIEMFIDSSSRLWINEMSPRPHNSFHHTIDACETSQFEQLLRAVSGLSLGETTLKSKALTLNLVADDDAYGPVDFQFRKHILRIPGAKLHWYGKTELRPHRKMGHVTLQAESLEELWAKKMEVEPWTRIKSQKKF